MSQAGRPRWWVAGLVVVLLLIGLVLWQQSRDTYVVGPQQPSAGAGALRADPGAAQAALEELTSRIAQGRSDGAGEVIAQIVTNAERIGLADVRARYVAEVGSAGADRWRAEISLTWRYAGIDTATATTEVNATFVRARDGAVSVAGFAPGDGRMPIWLTGAVRSRGDAQTRVVVSGEDPARVADYLRLVRTADRQVDRVLGEHDHPLVVQVPADGTEFGELLGATDGSYSGAAAVTTTADGSQRADAPVRVVVNPSVIGTLDGRGAQVVLTHEAVHVATDAARINSETMPTWLLEGFADYVALREVDLPLSTTAGQILKEVRAHGAPEQLPDASDFDATSEHFGRYYESAWLACRVLADEAGEDALVELYRRVLHGEDLETTMQEVAGFGVAELTQQWRDALERWAA